MRKKFITLFLSMFLIFNSVSFVSATSPIAVLPKVSMIYTVGSIALNLLGVTGDVLDVIDLGSSIFNKMSDSDKESFNDNVSYNNDSVSVDSGVVDILKPYLPSKNQFHLMTDVPRNIYLTSDFFYYDDSNRVSDDVYLNSLFDEHKKIITYQGIEFEILVYSAPSSSTYDNTGFLYKLPSDETLKKKTYKITKGSKQYLEIWISSILSSGGVMSFKWNYIKPDSTSVNVYDSGVLFNKLPSKCDNCPHDTSIKDKYYYPTKEEQEVINKYYPNLENDIPDIDSSVPPGGGGSSSPGGGGSSSPGGGGSSSVVTPLPSFPDLPTLDFSGIEFENFGNMFDNVKSKFPFSIPFDIANLLNLFKAEPKPPIFEVPFVGTSFTVDLTTFTPLVNIIGLFTVIGWVVFLISFTRKIGG